MARINDDPYMSMNVPDLSGGVNTRQHETEIQDNQLTVGDNINTSTMGKIKKRLGSNMTLDDLGDNHPILALNYLNAPGVDPRMCFIYNRRLYKSTDPINTSGSWVDIDSTDHFTADIASTDSILAGDIIMYSNGTDNAFSYDGTSITDEGATATDVPKAKCLAYFKNRLWAANTTTNPDYVYYSNTLAVQTFAQSTQVFKVSTGDGTAITNMIPYQGSSLVIFKEDSIHELVVQGTTSAYWNLRPIDVKHGCVAIKCAHEYGGTIIYLSRDGVRSLPPGQVPDSYLNKDAFDSINWGAIAKARAIIFDDKYYLAIATGVSSFNNSVFVLNLLTKAWTEITGWNVGSWGIWVDDNDEILMYGDAEDGEVNHCYKVTQFNDKSAAINFLVETKAYDFGHPFVYKVGGEVEVQIASSTGNTVTVYAAIDGGSYASLGSCTSTTKFSLDALEKFRNIKFKLQNNATSTEQLIITGIRVVTFLEEYY